MEQAAQSSPEQGNPYNEALEARRARFLSDVLSHGIVKHMRRSVPTEKPFFLRSDLYRVWSETPRISEPRPLDAVFYELDDGQRELISRKLVLFISFLIFVDVSPGWFSTCGTKLFEYHRHHSTELVFTDDDVPRSENQLRQIGLSPTQAAHWEEQYMFRPASIKFDPDNWRQEVDSCVPLPFEKDHEYSTTNSLAHVGDSDSTGYYSEYGTVQLYRIPEECVVQCGAETWMPITSPLRIVKSFIASQPALEEVENMDFLKGSLTKNHSIAIHDAIIERKREDHTRISIILPYASLGDLSQFLVDGVSDVPGLSTRAYDFREKFPRVATGYELDRSLLKQSAELADALKFLHKGFRTVADEWEITCAHMDLKPANIIIFESTYGIVGKWKLCDFGISVFNAEQHGQRGRIVSIGDYFNKVLKTTKYSPRRPPGSFQAPEVEFPAHSDNKDADTRPSDIWSFGAIFAEVLAYSSGRSNSVKEFRRLRTRRNPPRPIADDFFYTWEPPKDFHGDSYSDYGLSTSYSDCIVRVEVSEWLKGFDNDVYDPSQPSACLKCWATCVKSILEVHPKERPDATKLDQWILSLYKHSDRHGTTPCIAATLPKPLRAEDVRVAASSVHSSHSPRSSASAPYGSWPASLQAVESRASSWSISGSRHKPSTANETALIPTNSPDASGLSGSIRRPSNAQSNQQHTLNLYSDAVDHDIDGDKMAYLGKTHFQIFQLFPRNHSMEFRGGEPVPLGEREQRWKGISISGDYLVVWGTHGNLPVMRVYNVSEGPLQLQDVCNLPHFDPRMRIAVSKQGYIAMINNNFIHILGVRDQTVYMYRRYEMPTQGRISKFLRISFDVTGSILYAWGNQDIYGALFVYEITKEVPVFEGRYQNDYNGKRVVIIPLKGQTECIIAVESGLLFMGCIDPDRRQHMRGRTSTPGDLIPQDSFGVSQGLVTIAACVFNNSLILVQSHPPGRFPSRRKETGQICQQPLDPYETPVSTAQTHLTTLKQKPKADGSLNGSVKVGVVRLNEADIFIIVCHKDGKVELVPLEQDPG